jgi:hypothetical protein
MDKDLHPRVHITPWFPFELHHIKALYLNHQYKECVRRCEDLLAHNQVTYHRSKQRLNLTCMIG